MMLPHMPQQSLPGSKKSLTELTAILDPRHMLGLDVTFQIGSVFHFINLVAPITPEVFLLILINDLYIILDI